MDTTAAALRLTELYEIILANGWRAYFTPYDQPVVFQGISYQPIPIKRTSIEYHVDLQVDSVDVTFGIMGVVVGDLSYSIPRLIRNEFLRRARVKITRVDPTDTTRYELLFDGFATGGISYSSGGLTMKVNSVLDAMGDKFPQFSYTEQCLRRPYRDGCGLVEATYKESAAVLDNSTQTRIYSAVFAYAHKEQGWWLKGPLTFTSGGNMGVTRTIHGHGDGYVDLILPLVETVAPGDLFDVLAGCDRTGVTCHTKFNNYPNFLGFEYIPQPEVLYAW